MQIRNTIVGFYQLQREHNIGINGTDEPLIDRGWQAEGLEIEVDENGMQHSF